LLLVLLVPLLLVCRHRLTAPRYSQDALWQHHLALVTSWLTVSAKQSSLCAPLPHSGHVTRCVPMRRCPGSSPHSSISSWRRRCVARVAGQL
jgi:hypothetical protein